MKKWISLCLALTLAGNTGLFGADEGKKEMPRSSLTYGKSIAKIVFGLGGAAAAAFLADRLATRHMFVRNKRILFHKNTPTTLSSDTKPELISHRSLLTFYRSSLLSRIDKGTEFFATLLPLIVSGYVALQGVQELIEQLRTPKEIETEVVTQEEPQI